MTATRAAGAAVLVALLAAGACTDDEPVSATAPTTTGSVGLDMAERVCDSFRPLDDPSAQLSGFGPITVEQLEDFQKAVGDNALRLEVPDAAEGKRRLLFESNDDWLERFRGWVGALSNQYTGTT